MASPAATSKRVRRKSPKGNNSVVAGVDDVVAVVFVGKASACALKEGDVDFVKKECIVDLFHAVC